MKNVRFEYNGQVFYVGFKSAFNGHVDYEINGQRYYRITGRKGRPEVLYQMTGLDKLARHAHASYLVAERKEQRIWCHKQNITLGKLYRCANRNETF